MIRSKGVYIICIVVFLIVTICSACGNKKNKGTYKSDYKVAVIRTGDKSIGTDILYYDSDLNQVNKTKNNYGRIGEYNFGSPNVHNNKLYEASLGNDSEKDFGTVLEMDLELGEIEEIKFNRTGITDVRVNDDYIYVISNLNRKTYIDRYSFATKEIDSYTLNDQISLHLYICDNHIYIIKEENEKYILSYIDIDKQICNEVADVTKYYGEYGATSFYLYKDGFLYLAYRQGLLVYDSKTNELSNKSLNRQNIWGFAAEGNSLFVSCLDPYDSTKGAEIIEYNLKTEQILNEYQFEHWIMQFYIKNHELTVLGEECLYRYVLKDHNEMEKIAEEPVKDKDNQFISSFFVKD